jgi:hypothetical protein
MKLWCEAAEMIFDPDKILEIHKEAIALGLHKKRDLLLFGVNDEYVAGLDQAGNPRGQLWSDLVAMNKVGPAVCGVPLERWLRNAAYETRAQPDKQSFFRQLADQVVRIVLPVALASIYLPIKNTFEIAEIKRILINDVKRDTTGFSLLRGQDQSILCLLQEVDKRAWTNELLESLQNARPENKEFANEVARALEALKQDSFRLVRSDEKRLEIALPPCNGCWWRETAAAGAEAIAIEFRNHIADVRKGRGIPDLTDALFLRLANETTNLDLGAEIVETANTILRKTVDPWPGTLIAADFESKHVANAWSRVIVDADSRGTATLVALFLAIFLEGGTLSSIADTNLRILLNTEESRNV